MGVNMKEKENSSDSFFFSRGIIEMTISNSFFSIKELEFLFKSDLHVLRFFPRTDIKGNSSETIKDQEWLIYVYNR